MRLFIFKEKVDVPDNVEIRVEGLKVTVKGPKGTLSKDFSYAPVTIKLIEENVKGKTVRRVIVETYLPRKKEYATTRSIASHIKNMILGVTHGFRYYMKIIYAHFPVSVKVDEKRRVVIIENFLGRKAPIEAKIVGKDTKVYVKGDDVIVEGVDIEAVGQTVANIRQATILRGDERPCPHGRGGGPGVLDGIYPYKKEIIGLKVKEI